MKKLLLSIIVVLLAMSSAMAQRKLSKDELAKMTPEQRMAYDNDRKHKKKPRQQETTKEKVKRAKKEDRKARRIKRPKHKSK